MRYIVNEPIPADLPTVLVDGKDEALLDGYVSNNTVACLVDPKDHHRYMISASRVKAVN